MPSGSDEVFVYWNEMDGDQNNRGIYGQKFSPYGERLWNNNGKVFIEISSTNVYPFSASGSSEDMVLFYEQYTNASNAHVMAMCLDTEGDFLWEDESIALCSVSSAKIHPVANQFFNNQWIATWEDDRNGNTDIYAQNIQLDGTLGELENQESLSIFPEFNIL